MDGATKSGEYELETRKDDCWQFDPCDKVMETLMS